MASQGTHKPLKNLQHNERNCLGVNSGNFATSFFLIYINRAYCACLLFCAVVYFARVIIDNRARIVFYFY